MAKLSSKPIIFWIFGALCMFFGTLVLSAVESDSFGEFTAPVVVAYLLSLTMYMIGGMLWISIMHMHD